MAVRKSGFIFIADLIHESSMSASIIPSLTLHRNISTDSKDELFFY